MIQCLYFKDVPFWGERVHLIGWEAPKVSADPENNRIYSKMSPMYKIHSSLKVRIGAKGLNAQKNVMQTDGRTNGSNCFQSKNEMCKKA